MPHIERRYRTYYAVLDVPADVRRALQKRRFVQSLKTDSRSIAERRAARLVAGWKLAIDQARDRIAGHSNDPLEAEARFWRDALRKADTAAEREQVLSAIVDLAEEKWTRAAMRAGVVDRDETGFPGEEDANRFFEIATGRLIRTTEHLDEWLAAPSHITTKTKDQRRAAIALLSEAMPTTADVTRKAVRKWALDCIRERGLSIATTQRMLSDCRAYWRFLQAEGLVSEELAPFDRLEIGRGSRRQRSATKARQPFTPAEVVTFLQAAIEEEDQALADLIRLGMWTGCRLEELCSLRTENVDTTKRGTSVIHIKDAKTAAGRRAVPIHSKLRPTLVRLVKDSTDGFVLSGLKPNKYGDRGSALGKRFGRLKTRRGYGPQHVFHSIRKTVITILENAGVPEGVVADLVGHEKPTMTYGLYSGGASLETKRAVIEKLVYPSVSTSKA